MFNLRSPKNVHIHLTGLPRFCKNRLPYFRKAVSGSTLITGTFWKIHAVKQDKIQTAGPSMELLRKYLIGANEDWAQIKVTCNNFIEIQVENFPNLDNMQHFLIDKHNLRVSSQSVLSWMHAIYYSIEFLEQACVEADTLVFLTRPDLKINSAALRAVLNKLQKESIKNTIYLGKRMGQHFIYPSKYGNYKDLPVDHFFIAKFSDLSKFKELKNYLNQYLNNEVHTVPLVAEFLLADFMETVGLDWQGIDLPYTIWRGSFLKTFTSPFAGVASKRILIHFINFNVWKIVSLTKTFSSKL